MTEQTPNIFPAMRFADPDAAAEWLSRAFGFTTRAIHRDEHDVIRHAEMSLGAGTIMFGQGDPGSPGIYVAVEDADAHYKRAMEAGAEITRELQAWAMPGASAPIDRTPAGRGTEGPQRSPP